MGKWYKGDYIKGRAIIYSKNTLGGKWPKDCETIAIEFNHDKWFQFQKECAAESCDWGLNLAPAAVLPIDTENPIKRPRDFFISPKFKDFIDDIEITDKGLKIIVKCKDYKKRFKELSALGVYGPKDNRWKQNYKPIPFYFELKEGIK
jgi:hypothetical protein